MQANADHNPDKPTILFLGKSYIVETRFQQKSIVEVEDKIYVAGSSDAVIKRHLTGWLKQQARMIIQKRVALYAQRAGLSYNLIKITEAETRWGSCSLHKNLNFNWRLVMAPVSVIDYVVTHELAHLTEMNHSRQFWENVRRMFPIYRQYKTWLNRNGQLLRL